MYIVRNKQNEEVLHINPAPLSQDLSPTEIYHNYDPKTMEVLTSDLSRLPEHYNVNDNNEVVILTLEEQVTAGIITLEPGQKIHNGQIVQKPLEEQISEGLIELGPAQKVKGNQIVAKTLSEQVAEGLIQLSPAQKVKDNQIVEKTLTEQVAEGLHTLNEPFQYIQDEQIRSRSLEEVLDKNLITTADQCKEALDMLHRQIESTIHKEYSMGTELKIIKAYMEWTNEGKPEADKRETDFITMQQAIKTIKESFVAQKDQLKVRLAQL